jgi:hypothetical protein
MRTEPATERVLVNPVHRAKVDRPLCVREGMNGDDALEEAAFVALEDAAIHSFPAQRVVIRRNKEEAARSQ